MTRGAKLHKDFVNEQDALIKRYKSALSEIALMSFSYERPKKSAAAMLKEAVGIAREAVDA